jgi:hypothetical protein
MVTNVINGGLECNMPTNDKVVDRVEYYKRYAGVLNVAVDEATLYLSSRVALISRHDEGIYGDCSCAATLGRPWPAIKGSRFFHQCVWVVRSMLVVKRCLPRRSG